MPGTVFGRQPSPRALIKGFDEHDQTVDALADLFPTARKVDSLTEVSEDEYDILITSEYSFPEPQPHLFVVSVGKIMLAGIAPPDPFPSQFERGERPWHGWLRQGGYTRATEFEVPEHLPPSLKRLVHTDLLPLCMQRRIQEDVPLPYVKVEHPGPDVPISLLLRPLLTTTEPATIAAVFRRLDGGLAECLVLPDGVDVVAWTAAAVETWCGVDSQRFPAPPAWEHAERWMTRAERERAKDLANVEREWKEVEVAFARRRADAEKDLVEARHAADTGHRRMLVAQGDDLVEAVAGALAALGFDVTNMDAVWPTNDRREDLRVTAQDHPAWTAIVEIRGYARGAAQNDLLRIAGRFVPRYMQDEDRPPSGAWYIVNHNFRQDPRQRAQVLAGNDPEIATFAEGIAAGLVVDTVSLFELVLAVEEGLVQRAEARTALITQAGIFRWPQA